MSLYSWKQLARWSIDYSCLSPNEQTQAHEILARDWTQFCEFVVERYSPIMNGDEVDEVKAKTTDIYRKRVPEHP